MSDLRCPNCDAVLTAIDRAAGWCDHCGKKIPAFVQNAVREPAAAPPTAERPPFVIPNRFRRGPTARARFWAGVGVLAVLVLGLAGVVLYFVLRPDVAITVDNGDSTPLTVLLDGSEKLTLPPGKAEVLWCRSGSHHLTVRRGGETVFDQTKELQSGHGGKPRRYLLNPGAVNRYWVRTVHYGLDIPPFGMYFDDADHYRQLADQIKLAPPGDWVDADPDLVLEPPPKEVRGNIAETRVVLSPISRADYDLIAGAGKKESVTPDDVSRMESLVDRLLKTGQ